MGFNLEINYLGGKLIVQNLSSNGYEYLFLLNDVCGVALGNRAGWLSNRVIVEGVLPSTGDAIIINNDEDVKSLIAIYLSIGLQNVCVNLHVTRCLEVESSQNIISSSLMTGVHEDENLISTKLIVNDELDEEGRVDVEEIVEWSDSKFEKNAKNDECVLPKSNDDDDGEEDEENNLSDYSSDNDQSIYHIDEDLQATNPIAVLNDNIEGESFELKYDHNGNQIIILKEGQIFDTVQHFKDILPRYTIQEGIKLKKFKNDKVRLTVMCNNGSDCSWRLHASTYADGVTFKIKNIKGHHIFVRNLKGGELTAKWIANKFKDEYKNNTSKSVEELDCALRSKYGIHANSSKLFRARKMAMQVASGDHENSYVNIPRYIAAIKESNSGAYVKLKCDGLDFSNPHCIPKFERLFISFEAQCQGYAKGCRPFIGVDGCFLKGPYKGELFTAVALDANSEIFPI